MEVAERRKPDWPLHSEAVRRTLRASQESKKEIPVEWWAEVHMEGYFEQNDPLKFSPYQNVIFPNTAPHFDGHPQLGKIFAILPKSKYQDLSTDRKKVVDTCTLTRGSAKVYARIFGWEAAKSSIPWILDKIRCSQLFRR
jgi:hypothetical protein